jgi:hypothetical protein
MPRLPGSRFRHRLVVSSLAIVAASLLLLTAAPDTAGQTETTPDTCGSGSVTLAAVAPPGSGQPAGFSLSPLAEKETDSLPTAPVRLFLSRIRLAPGSVAETRAADGPILYYVETGTASISINGEPTSYGPRQAAMVPMDELYALVNPSGSEPVSLLRLAVAPANVDSVPVADFLVPPSAGIVAISSSGNPSPSQPTSALLFRADLNALPQQPFRLLLACAAWTATPDPTATMSFSGPVGVRIVSGVLLLGEDRKIGETGCTLFEPGQPFEAGAGNPAPSGILFGLVPAGTGLWQPTGSGSSASSVTNVSCGAA